MEPNMETDVNEIELDRHLQREPRGRHFTCDELWELCSKREQKIIRDDFADVVQDQALGIARLIANADESDPEEAGLSLIGMWRAHRDARLRQRESKLTERI
jgi:hypothetical protein